MSKEYTNIGEIIDLPIEDFKLQLAKAKLNVGYIHNIYLNLVSAYNELCTMKDGLIESVKREERTPQEIEDTMNGIYAELMKIEEKCLYLKQLEEELLKLS